MWKLIFFLINLINLCANYEIGVGIADISGPIVGITFMGYGNLEQQGTGLHTRQWSRAFIINDGENRFVFVSADLGMMGDGVRQEVITQLEKKFNGIYNIDNVMISATHTHSAPGGYLMHTLFDLSSFGFSNETFQAIVSGIVKSISKAHQNLQKGKLLLSKGEVLDVNINRSPTAYEANPKEERDRYPYNVDKQMTQLKFLSEDGRPLGVINWYAVHATSMNNTNTLSSSDNVGYASIKFEEKMNPGRIIGKGPFVAAFASSNLGDVSPNVMGPKCQKSGKECDIFSQCNSMFDSCFATGPGKDMFESTKIIGERLLTKAWDLWNNGETLEMSGPVKSIHQYVDMPTAEAEILNKTTGELEKIHGCLPAMGYSFAAGTIDGPFSFLVKQGMTNGFWWLDPVRNRALARPTDEDIACHSPKPILLPSGHMAFPFEWQPRVVSTHLAIIGNIAIAGVPGEFTTMSGRRVRNVIHETINVDEVIIAGLSNTYSDYIATYEEYQVQRFEAAATLYGPHTLTLHLKQCRKLAEYLNLVQRYEGASTLFGPHTLSLHLNQFRKLAETFVSEKPFKSLERGPEPVGLDNGKMYSFILPVVFDTPKFFYDFGDVLVQPEKENQHGDVVVATFVAAHPRNDLKLDDTYLLVEREVNEDYWKVVATDANWETKIHWRRTVSILGNSEIDIEWTIPENIPSGWYRIRHFGNYRTLNGQIFPFEGETRKFQVHTPRNVCLLP